MNHCQPADGTARRSGTGRRLHEGNDVRSAVVALAKRVTVLVVAEQPPGFGASAFDGLLIGTQRRSPVALPHLGCCAE